MPIAPRKPNRRRPWGVVVAAAALCVPTAAAANVWNVYGAGARNIALGGSTVATTQDWSSGQTNPAGIAFAEDVESTIGIFAAMPRLTVRYRGRPEHRLRAVPGRKANLEDHVGPIVGFVLPGQGFSDEPVAWPWAVGFALYLPGESAFVQRAFRPSEPFSVVYHERPLQIGLLLYGAVRVLPSLSLGAGITVNAAAPTTANTIASLDGRQFTNTNVDTRLSPSFTLGIQFRPTDRLSFGVSFIQRQRLNVRGRATVAFGLSDGFPALPAIPVSGLPAFNSQIRFVTGYTPPMLTGGFAYKLTESLEVSAAIQWRKWDNYRATNGLAPPNRFRNTLTPRLGIEYRPLRDLALRAGFCFEPSPVTEQTQGFNLLDSDRWVPSAGLGWTFQSPLGFKKPITLDVAAFAHILETRRFDQHTPPPPIDLLSPGQQLIYGLLVPGYPGVLDVDEPHTFSGHVIGLTASLTVRF
ncbi:MAG: TonB-dependent receptor [Myxococcales bacterium]|nr:TonB-dependent receptor [Myxococcales bacterium]